jgi:uncharacterized protein DUF222
MSTTTGLESRAHPIARFFSRVHQVVDGLAGVPAWSMTADQQRAALVELARAEARLVELRLRVLAAADRSDVAADTAATSTAAWVAHATRQTPAAAHTDLKLALALDGSFPATRDALAAGALDEAQAKVVVHAIGALPETVGSSDRERAEQHLIGLAGQFDAKTLKRLGRHLFEVIDPAAADPAAADLAEGRRLEAEETAAARAAYLRLCDNGDGSHTGRPPKSGGMSAAAPPRAATDPPAGATPTTTRPPGRRAPAPASTRPACCAPSTTAKPTHPATR